VFLKVFRPHPGPRYDQKRAYTGSDLPVIIQYGRVCAGAEAWEERTLDNFAGDFLQSLCKRFAVR
jgi:hypothetical protein